MMSIDRLTADDNYMTDKTCISPEVRCNTAKLLRLIIKMRSCELTIEVEVEKREI